MPGGQSEVPRQVHWKMPLQMWPLELVAQSVELRHWTQVSLKVRQMGVGEEQSALVRHWTQALVAVLQTPALPPQSAFVEQPQLPTRHAWLLAWAAQLVQPGPHEVASVSSTQAEPLQQAPVMQVPVPGPCGEHDDGQAPEVPLHWKKPLQVAPDGARPQAGALALPLQPPESQGAVQSALGSVAAVAVMQVVPVASTTLHVGQARPPAAQIFRRVPGGLSCVA
jgi:hypothetical protein